MSFNCLPPTVDPNSKHRHASKYIKDTLMLTPPVNRRSQGNVTPEVTVVGASAELQTSWSTTQCFPRRTMGIISWHRRFMRVRC
jgi:hypothetical protein